MPAGRIPPGPPAPAALDVPGCANAPVAGDVKAARSRHSAPLNDEGRQEAALLFSVARRQPDQPLGRINSMLNGLPVRKGTRIPSAWGVKPGTLSAMNPELVPQASMLSNSPLSHSMVGN